MKKLLAVLGIAMPVFGQYAGPAILSRGDAPSAMNGPDLTFRPFVEVSGVYSTGLASSVAVNSQGDIANYSAAGVSIAGGISGSHRWRHTSLGLSYRAQYDYYPRNTGYSGFDQSMLVGIRHQLSRHVMLGWDSTLGIINRSYGLLATISPAVSFDPGQNTVPITDFFDNRLITASSQARLVVRKSARMSFSFSGGIFADRYASTALYGVLGENAYGDVQYRLTKMVTIGVNYNYTHYGFAQILGDTNMQGASGTVAWQLSRWWEFTGYGGFMRVETKFVQDVPVDPAIAAIIGITESSEVVYSARYVPNVMARLSRTLHNGVVYVSGGRLIDAGNGLFLTSSTTIASAGYTYTGLRRWSVGANVSYNQSRSIGNVIGNYGGLSATASLSRTMAHGMSLIGNVTVQRYNSTDFSKYNSVVYSAGLGLGWSPGDVPLRIW